MTDSKRAAIYVRVSSKKQLAGNGLEDQLNRCRDYATAHGFEIANEFVEKGVSGATLKRPELDKLRTLAGKVDAVIIPVHSRLSRADDVIATLDLMREIEQAGTEIHTTNRGRVTTLNMAGIIMAVVDLYQATEERNQLIKKVRASHHTSAKNGKISATRCRYGYKFVSRELARGTHKLVIDEDAAEVVRDIYEWFTVAGPLGPKLTTGAIARELTRRGVSTAYDKIDRPSPKLKQRGVWGQATVRQILINPLYKGKPVYGKTRVEWYENDDGDRVSRKLLQPENLWKVVPVDPIVSEELWDAAQRQFKINATNNPRRAVKGRYMLRGLITCSRCNFKFFGEQAKPHISVYRCAGTRKNYARDGKTLTCHGSFRVEILDELAWQAIKSFLLDPDSLAAGQAAMGKGKHTKESALRKRQRDVAKKIVDKHIQEERMIDAYRDGVISKSQLQERLDTLKSDITALQSEGEGLDRELAQVAASDKTRKSIAEFCHEVTRNIEYLTEIDKREVLETLNVKILLDREQNVLILTGAIPTMHVPLPDKQVGTKNLSRYR